MKMKATRRIEKSIAFLASELRVIWKNTHDTYLVCIVACSRLSVVMGERIKRAGKRGKNEAGSTNAFVLPHLFLARPRFSLSPSTTESRTGYVYR